MLVKDPKGLLLAFWSIRNLSNLAFIFSFCRGVGCIFVEMIQGVAAFPGMKDIQDQLERIFLVSSLLMNKIITKYQLINVHIFFCVRN